MRDIKELVKEAEEAAEKEIRALSESVTVKQKKESV